LTGMESRVAVLLARGMSVKEIAAATGRKESTIRTHVKHMFAKHGLSRQADLVRLVRSLAGLP
ncbi:MAG: helix-turn-helix transcriptional regulator, partial [Rhodospirillaceae bacterium]|nr:helix-turn-helix transcriptional regulator [Rhodospirillaceae bacterium]